MKKSPAFFVTRNNSHARDRLRWWLRKKHKVKGSGTGKFPDEYLCETLGLYRLETTTRGVSLQSW